MKWCIIYSTCLSFSRIESLVCIPYMKFDLALTILLFVLILHFFLFVFWYFYLLFSCKHIWPWDYYRRWDYKVEQVHIWISQKDYVLSFGSTRTTYLCVTFQVAVHKVICGSNSEARKQKYFIACWIICNTKQQRKP